MQEPKPLVDLNIGKRHYFMTSCHRLPERSLIFHGKPLLCYRCLGLNGAFFLVLMIQMALTIVGQFHEVKFTVLYPIDYLSQGHQYLKFITTIFLQIPFVLDGSIQAIADWYESNNILRFLTGLLGGYGQFAFIFLLGQSISILID